MLTIDLDADELARTRFACSALHETVASLRVLADPGAHAMHLPWVRRVTDRLAGHDVTLLRSLVPATGYIPDFLAPPPRSPLPDLEAELARVGETAHEQVRIEVEWTLEDDPRAQPLLHDPAATLQRALEQLTLYHELALADDWLAIRTVLEADIAHRARELAREGARTMVARLHPALRWEDRLRVSLASGYEADVVLDGQGLLLMPSVFTWPELHATVDPPWQPTIVYPARGVAALWEPTVGPPQALARILGRTRAALLEALEVPRTGLQLATALRITPGAVSQHVGALRAAGLIATHREGRHVVSRRTALGDELLGAGDGQRG